MDKWLKTSLSNKKNNSNQESLDHDFAVALSLQTPSSSSDASPSPRAKSQPRSLIDPVWETIDPNPNIYVLFAEFNRTYFWDRLQGVEVRWSPRMTSCAGMCCYEGRGGLCSVRLSQPLLRFRPRSDLVETLLHEMIHAYLFVVERNRDHGEHGPMFLAHMHRINRSASTNISVYHNFHDEVKFYQQHWWRCNGPCQQRPPYFGMVKRAMNRAPGPNDIWWAQHQATCGGQYIKVREPEGFNKGKKRKVEEVLSPSAKKGQKDIRSFVPFGGPGQVLGTGKMESPKGLPSGSQIGLDGSHGFGVNCLNGNGLIDGFQKGAKVQGGSGMLSDMLDVQGNVRNGTSGTQNYIANVYQRITDGVKSNKTKTGLTKPSLNKSPKKTPRLVHDLTDTEEEKSPVKEKQVTIDKYFTPVVSEVTASVSSFCPGCGIRLPENDLYVHMVTCANPDEKSENLATGVIDIDGEYYPCPVCQVGVLASLINQHLDTCLKS